MRMGIRIALCVLCLLLSYLGTLANWGGSADGCIGSGNFQALGTQQVRMAQEQLAIELYRDRAKIKVEYVLVNTGGPLTVTAGFPCAVYNPPEGRLVEIEEYQISVDGREISYVIRTGAEAKGFKAPAEFTAILEGEEYLDAPPALYWLVSQVPFAAGAERRVSINYVALYNCSEGGVSSDTVYSADILRYLLSTGGVWQGPIGSGEVTIKAVTVDPAAVALMPPNRFRREGDIFRWSFRDLEPTTKDDITISLHNEVAVYSLYDPDAQDEWYSSYGDQYFFDSHRYKVQASSELRGPFSYQAANVRDMNPVTAWVEGVAGDGIGESLTITLDRPAKGIELGIIPGYAKSREIYFANNRVAEFKIIVNGSLTMTRRLWDDWTRHGPWSPKAYQFIALDGNVEVKTVKLIINKVYKGLKYQDTAISEILLRQKLAKKPAIQGAR